MRERERERENEQMRERNDMAHFMYTYPSEKKKYHKKLGRLNIILSVVVCYPNKKHFTFQVCDTFDCRRF